MLTPEKIKDAIHLLLRQDFPTLKIYTDLLPAEFIRPSLYLTLLEMQQQNIARNTIEESVVFTIACYTNLQADEGAAYKNLDQMVQEVYEVFRGGVFMVEDRAVRCLLSSKKEMDIARVEVTVNYWETRKETPVEPLIGSVEIYKKEIV